MLQRLREKVSEARGVLYVGRGEWLRRCSVCRERKPAAGYWRGAFDNCEQCGRQQRSREMYPTSFAEGSRLLCSRCRRATFIAERRRYGQADERERAAMILALREFGMVAGGIAERLGIQEPTVRRVLRRAGRAPDCTLRGEG